MDLTLLDRFEYIYIFFNLGRPVEQAFCFLFCFEFQTLCPIYFLRES